jgi:hypothetical protein
MLDGERTLVKLRRRIILVVRTQWWIIIADNPCDNRDRFRAGLLLAVRRHFDNVLSLRWQKGLSLYFE